MLDAARIFASVAVILLIAAIAAWVNPSRLRKLRLLNGSAVANFDSLQIAALLLLAAFGLSAVAAILAAGWFAT